MKKKYEIILELRELGYSWSQIAISLYGSKNYRFNVIMLYKYALNRLKNLDSVYTSSDIAKNLEGGAEEENNVKIGIYENEKYEFLETSQHPLRVLKKDLRGPERNWAELRNFISRIHGRLGFPANVLNIIFNLMNNYRGEIVNSLSSEKIWVNGNYVKISAKALALVYILFVIAFRRSKLDKSEYRESLLKELTEYASYDEIAKHLDYFNFLIKELIF
ncbi:hypothetical protein [Sulfolobus super-elliptical virus]|nr:hypothetical protein [Sulfolobus super-elliptical virus]